MGNIWQKEEIEYLEYLYIIDGLSLSELYPIFNLKYDRSLISVKIKIKKLKLTHTKEQTSLIKSRLNSGENNGMFGKTSWSKGKNKNNCNTLLKSSKKLSEIRKEMYKNGLINTSGENNGMYKKEPWNKGQTKETNISIFKYSEKISIIKKELWKNLTDEEKLKRINLLIKNANTLKKNTKIELIIESSLNDLGIDFKRNYLENVFLLDFYIPKSNLVIECQGDYWHANPEIYKDKKLTKSQIINIERDKRKLEYLIKNNFNYLFLWENFIKNNNMKEILMKYL